MMTDTATSPKLLIAVADGVGILTLNDPGTLNAASLDLMAELHEAFEDFAARDEVRAILVIGSGRGFCSGANLSPAGARARGTFKGALPGLVKSSNPLLSAMRRSTKPLVAGVNGVAAGFGVSLALACDLVVAAESAYFLCAFRRIGMVPDGGASWLLPRLIGKARTMELLLLGNRLPAHKAVEWGLVNRCVPDDDLLESATAMARTLADGPASLGRTRRMVWEGLETSWAAQIEAEAYAQGDAMRSVDGQEGMKAFVEKRAPDFRRQPVTE